MSDHGGGHGGGSHGGGHGKSSGGGGHGGGGGGHVAGAVAGVSGFLLILSSCVTNILDATRVRDIPLGFRPGMPSSIDYQLSGFEMSNRFCVYDKYNPHVLAPKGCRFVVELADGKPYYSWIGIPLNDRVPTNKSLWLWDRFRIGAEDGKWDGATVRIKLVRGDTHE